jgi:hypothetical protein
LPVIGTKYLTQLFSDVLFERFFPSRCKVAQIIFISKPGKSSELTFYRQISLLPIVANDSGKLLLRKLLAIVENNDLIPNHQFGFRQRHSTI